MSTAAITRHEPADEAIELAIVEGDLSRLSSAQRRSYYLSVCRSLDLNPLTKPFEYLRLNGKLLLYAKKDCTDQLRGRRGVSVDIIKRVVENDICEVTAKAVLDGRTDMDVGAVFVGGLRGEALANAIMKAHTKAKRRVTLSICGLSMPDESEVDTIRGAERVVDDETAPRHLAPAPASTPPPALHDGGPQSALWSAYSAEFTKAESLDELKAIGQRVANDAKAGKLTLTQVATLKDVNTQRKRALKERPRETVAEVLANNPMPEAWGGEPEPKDAPCIICGKPLGGAAAISTETADGEIGERHMTCANPHESADEGP
jgi:hypothetical protein